MSIVVCLGKKAAYLGDKIQVNNLVLEMYLNTMAKWDGNEFVGENNEGGVGRRSPRRLPRPVSERWSGTSGHPKGNGSVGELGRGTPRTANWTCGCVTSSLHPPPEKRRRPIRQDQKADLREGRQV